MKIDAANYSMEAEFLKFLIETFSGLFNYIANLMEGSFNCKNVFIVFLIIFIGFRLSERSDLIRHIGKLDSQLETKKSQVASLNRDLIMHQMN